MFPPETMHTTLPVPAFPANAPATPAAEGDDDRIDIRQVLEHLEADGPVARHHRFVAERVHEEAIDALALVRAERVEPLVVRHGNDRAAEALDRLDLRRGSAIGYDDRARDAQPTSVPRDTLRHVPGARGPHAPRELLARDLRHLVARAADLERADRL